ncbi:hypothetical protein ACFC09_38065 [Streptomyces sp. NPDC056161]|uniref:hypothetical protein n=1 Tax=Streptomyces sp. NPDC056161 TaxID=3345732 RepID=UPI0035E19FEB
MVTITHDVFVNEGVFGLLDAGEIPAQSADWSNGFVAPMTEGALIATGINTGLVRVTIQGPNEQTPGQTVDDWEEVVEASVHAPMGKLSLESLELGPPADGSTVLSPAGPAWYRMRVHARGRALNVDGVSMEPVEDYLIITWPAPPTDITIMRTSDHIEQCLRTPQPGTTPQSQNAELNPPSPKPE